MGVKNGPNIKINNEYAVVEALNRSEFDYHELEWWLDAANQEQPAPTGLPLSDTLYSQARRAAIYWQLLLPLMELTTAQFEGDNLVVNWKEEGTNSPLLSFSPGNFYSQGELKLLARVYGSDIELELIERGFFPDFYYPQSAGVAELNLMECTFEDGGIIRVREEIIIGMLDPFGNETIVLRLGEIPDFYFEKGNIRKLYEALKLLQIHTLDHFFIADLNTLHKCSIAGLNLGTYFNIYVVH